MTHLTKFQTSGQTAHFEPSAHPRGEHGRFSLKHTPANSGQPNGGGFSLMGWGHGSKASQDAFTQRWTDAKGGRAWGVGTSAIPKGSAPASWQSLGSKLPGLPAEYTQDTHSLASQDDKGSFKDIVLRTQQPKSISKADHDSLEKKLFTIIQITKAPIVERGLQDKLIPDGTPKHTINRAYNHASMLALHDYGTRDYDFHMDDNLKTELTPMIPFMRYTRRRVKDNFLSHPETKGQWGPYRKEFGKPFADNRKHKITGEVRLRNRPNNEFIKSLDGHDDYLQKGLFGQFAAQAIEAASKYGAQALEAAPGAISRAGNFARDFGSHLIDKPSSVASNPEAALAGGIGGLVGKVFGQTGANIGRKVGYGAANIGGIYGTALAAEDVGHRVAGAIGGGNQMPAGGSDTNSSQGNSRGWVPKSISGRGGLRVPNLNKGIGHELFNMGWTAYSHLPEGGDKQIVRAVVHHAKSLTPKFKTIKDKVKEIKAKRSLLGKAFDENKKMNKSYKFDYSTHEGVPNIHPAAHAMLPHSHKHVAFPGSNGTSHPSIWGHENLPPLVAAIMPEVNEIALKGRPNRRLKSVNHHANTQAVSDPNTRLSDLI